MKKFMVLCLSFLLVLGAAGCSSSSSDSKSETLVIYTPNSEGLVNAVIPLFEEKYNIKVELQQAGTGELFKRLENEKADPIADVMFGGAFSMFTQHEDLFEKYTAKDNAKVLEAYQNKNGYVTSYTLDGSVLIYNKNLIGDIKLDGYEALLNPALKGKIAVGDPSSSSSAFAQLTNMLLAMGGYDDDAAWQYVEDLFTNIDGKIIQSSSGVYKGVADGEYTVGLTYEDPSVNLLQDGADIEVVYPVEGSVYLPAGSGIIKGAKNMENAKLFMDFLISQEVQDNLGTTTTNRPVLKEVKTSEAMKSIQEIYVIEEDMTYVGTHKDEIVNHYKDIFTRIASK